MPIGPVAADSKMVMTMSSPTLISHPAAAPDDHYPLCVDLLANGAFTGTAVGMMTVHPCCRVSTTSGARRLADAWQHPRYADGDEIENPHIVFVGDVALLLEVDV